ncbi:DUF84 family protein [Halalkalibacter oceani]|uniref:Probable inosine/xanthosine triphosphatase n=1 Tax=Halalkalibacter oceani TaxID=1653776 RepID=A0A9X2IQ11_9BACI|nr:DUF84 family protein [Halalkalibacter oceani]MCM3714982.1 DUF84 family protein [Halalkalibacter oceani]
MKVAVGTKNPAKVHAVKDTLIRETIHIASVDVPSNVASQPFSDEETMTGALNRAKAAAEQTGAVLGFGLEGGVVRTVAGLMLCNWGALYHEDGRHWIAGGARLPLPDEVAKRLEQGEELGIIMSSITGDEAVRKKEGAIGIYTSGLVSRKEMFSQIVKLLYGQYLASTTQLKH